MATELPGYDAGATATTQSADGDKWAPRSGYNAAIGAGASGASVNYLMQAADSVTGTVYRWTVTSLEAGFAGTGYPGPNAPTNIAVSVSAAF